MPNDNRFIIERNNKRLKVIEVTNFYSRAGMAINIVKDALALKVLLSLYPAHKNNVAGVAEKLLVESSLVQDKFDYLDSSGLVKDNPTSGRKVLTDEGRLFLEQTSTVFPELKKFLEEQKEQTKLVG